MRLGQAELDQKARYSHPQMIMGIASEFSASSGNKCENEDQWKKCEHKLVETTERCLVCNYSAKIVALGGWYHVSCVRCGTYRISGAASKLLPVALHDSRAQARLSHAIRRRDDAGSKPEITSENLYSLAAEKLPGAEQKIDNLLVWLASELEDSGAETVNLSSAQLAGVIGVLSGTDDIPVALKAVEMKLAALKNSSDLSLTKAGWARVKWITTSLKPHKERTEPKELKPTEPEPTEPTPMIQTTAKRVFIGHGRSLTWHLVREFLVNDLGLQYEEFNREVAAGVSTQDRLAKMLDGASFAFIVMTAEDETGDKKFQARQNVIHELGLFQGKLGFDKAIILLEQGCEIFSNIHGLGYIPIQKDSISSATEEIRRVLKRGGVL